MGRPVRVSCIIPAYNEGATIAHVVAAARGCAAVDEVIVVSDGSTDATARRASQAGARVVELASNRGKSDAVLAGLRRAQGEVIVLLDADLLCVRPDHIAALVHPVLRGSAGMAVASFGADPWHMRLTPLSGQRCFRRAMLGTSEAIKGTGFGLEMALDRLARRSGTRVTPVVWQEVRHRSKREKYGTVDALRLKIRVSSDLLRQARPPGKSLPIATPRRTSSMLLAVILLIAVIVVVTPVFLMHPPHASATDLLAAPLPAAGDRLLVVVAHPDDEVIGAGGLIAMARQRGAAVHIIVVTNGDSNRLSAAVLSHKIRPGAAQLLEEGSVRQDEALRALAALGVPAADVYFLGFPDRALTEVMRSRAPYTSPFTHVNRAVYPGVVARDVPYTRTALLTVTAQIVARVRPTVIVTHAPFDRHADHQAVASLVDEVREQTPIFAFLVHAPGFPRPLRRAPRAPLVPPADLRLPDRWTWARLDLPTEIATQKQHAISCYRSQLMTPYLRLLLLSFIRTNELYAVHAP